MMSEHDNQNARRPPRWIVFGVATLMIYVLSLGPAVRFANRLGLPLKASLRLAMVYLPLIWVSEYCPWFKSFLDWYVSWFRR